MGSASQPCVERDGLGGRVALVAAAKLSDPVVDYVVAWYAPHVCLPISPWCQSAGAAMLAAAARAPAVLDGRDYVIPDDVKALALPALRHRVILSPAAEIDGRKVDEIVHGVIEHRGAALIYPSARCSSPLSGAFRLALLLAVLAPRGLWLVGPGLGDLCRWIDAAFGVSVVAGAALHLCQVSDGAAPDGLAIGQTSTRPLRCHPSPRAGLRRNRGSGVRCRGRRVDGIRPIARLVCIVCYDRGGRLPQSSISRKMLWPAGRGPLRGGCGCGGRGRSAWCVVAPGEPRSSAATLADRAQCGRRVKEDAVGLFRRD